MLLSSTSYVLHKFTGTEISVCTCVAVRDKENLGLNSVNRIAPSELKVQNTESDEGNIHSSIMCRETRLWDVAGDCEPEADVVPSKGTAAGEDNCKVNN